MAREDACLAPVAPDDVGASALHVVTGQTDAKVLLFERADGKRGIEKTQQPVERLLITAVRGGRQQHHVTGRVLGQGTQELEALLPAAMRANASMGLVDDDQRRTCASKTLSASVALDVVEADDRVWMGVKKGLGDRQAALQSGSRGCGYRDRVEVELRFEFPGPLFDEVRRAQDGEALDLASIHQLTKNEARLDRLAYADVIGDEKPNGRQAQRHEQRHELVSPWLEAEASSCAKRAGSASHRQVQRVGQQPCAVLGRGIG